MTLTAETTGGNPGNSVYGVYNVNAAPVLTDVTIRTDAKSGVYGSYGIYSTNSAPVLTQISVTVAGAIEQTYGIYSNGTLAGASPSMTHVAVTASVPAVVQSRTHVGVYNASNAPIMTDVTVTLSDASTYNYDYGVENYANTGPVLMTNVAVAASGGSGSQVHGVYNNSGWVDMREVVSRAVGGSYAVGIRIDCASAAAKAANAVTALNSVTASGTGAVGDANYGNYGVYNYNYYCSSDPTPTLTNVTAIATGDINTFGVRYYAGATSTITGLVAQASGASSYNYGIHATSTNLTIQNSTISGSGGAHGWGISTGVNTVTVNNSQISGSEYTVNAGSATIKIGGSQLNGGSISNSGSTVTCAGVYDEAYTFYPSTCP